MSKYLISIFLALLVHTPILLIKNSQKDRSPSFVPVRITREIRTIGDKKSKNNSFLEEGRNLPKDLSKLSLANVDASFFKDTRKKLYKPQQSINISPKQMQNYTRNLPIYNSPLKTNLGLSFETPYGVSKEELNALELKFYGVFRRIGISYIENTYAHLTPFFSLKDNNYQKYKNVFLQGKVIYSKKGKLLDIKIKNNSIKNDLNSIFEKILKKTLVRNIPDELLSGEKFIVNFHLQLL